MFRRHFFSKLMIMPCIVVLCTNQNTVAFTQQILISHNTECSPTTRRRYRAYSAVMSQVTTYYAHHFKNHCCCCCYYIHSLLFWINSGFDHVSHGFNHVSQRREPLGITGAGIYRHPTNSVKELLGPQSNDAKCGQ